MIHIIYLLANAMPSTKWQIEHPERVKELRDEYRKRHPNYMKEYRRTHREQYRGYYQKQKQYQRDWRKQNPERVKKYDKKQYEIHKEQVIKRVIVWNKTHPKNHRKTNKKYHKNHPEVHRRGIRKSKAKRRGLGDVELNEPFIGADGHHIDKECVVYIPHELHNSIRHCVWTGHNMETINDKAFEWLIEHDVLA